MTVPAGAIVNIDFIARTAFVAGTGSVGIEQLVGSDPAHTSYSTEYTPAGLTPYGYDYTTTGNNKPLAFINELKTAFLDGKSIVIKFQSGPPPAGWPGEDFQTDSYVNGPSGQRSFQTGTGVGEIWGYTTIEPQLLFTDVWDYAAVPGGAINAFGFTLVPSNYYDIAGNNKQSGRRIITDNDTPPGYPFLAIALDAYGPVASITAFERLNTAELQAQTAPVLQTQTAATYFVNYRSTALQAGL